MNAYNEGDMSLQCDTHTRIAVTITSLCKQSSSKVQGREQGENVPIMRNRLQLCGERRKAFAQWLLETGQKPTETVGANDNPGNGSKKPHSILIYLKLEESRTGSVVQ